MNYVRGRLAEGGLALCNDLDELRNNATHSCVYDTETKRFDANGQVDVPWRDTTSC